MCYFGHTAASIGYVTEIQTGAVPILVRFGTPTAGNKADDDVRATRVVLSHTTARKSVVKERSVDLCSRRLIK